MKLSLGFLDVCRGVSGWLDFCTSDYSYHRLFVPSLDYSYHRRFVPWTVRTITDYSYLTWMFTYLFSLQCLFDVLEMNEIDDWTTIS